MSLGRMKKRYFNSPVPIMFKYIQMAGELVAKTIELKIMYSIQYLKYYEQESLKQNARSYDFIDLFFIS